MYGDVYEGGDVDRDDDDASEYHGDNDAQVLIVIMVSYNIDGLCAGSSEHTVNTQ